MHNLQQQLFRADTLAGKLRRLLPGTSQDRACGIYLWGGVGRGKTFLMDLFFGSLKIEKKKRIHFHRMMRDIHARLKTLDSIAEPLDHVAASIASETRVLCFDEFFVSDIGDAMILGKLLEGLFDRGVVLVTTSNAHPADLYKNGLQRERFGTEKPLLQTVQRVNNPELRPIFDLTAPLYSGSVCLPDTQLGPQFEMADYIRLHRVCKAIAARMHGS